MSRCLLWCFCCFSFCASTVEKTVLRLPSFKWFNCFFQIFGWRHFVKHVIYVARNDRKIVNDIYRSRIDLLSIEIEAWLLSWKGIPDSSWNWVVSFGIPHDKATCGELLKVWNSECRATKYGRNVIRDWIGLRCITLKYSLRRLFRLYSVGAC
jgi:hypothetical protein